MVAIKNFQLDKKLATDCLVLGELDISLVLLMNNALVPWFILVPRVTALEFCEIDEDTQVRLNSEINQISRFVKAELDIDKLNVAVIGNIVKQLHVHIIGRKKSDYCWPDVVWGTSEKRRYREDEVRKLTELLDSSLGPIFNRHY